MIYILAYLSFAIFLDLDRGCPTSSVFLERDRHDLAFRRNIARERDAPNAWQNQHVPCDRELTTPVHQARERLAYHRCFNGVTLWGRESFPMHTMSFHVFQAGMTISARYASLFVSWSRQCHKLACIMLEERKVYRMVSGGLSLLVLPVAGAVLPALAAVSAALII